MSTDLFPTSFSEQLNISVQEDVISSLSLDRERMSKVLDPFNRANLFYEVRYVANLTPEERPHLSSMS